MPFLNIYTNVNLEKIEKEKFIQEALLLVANELNKPSARTIVNYIYNPNMLFGNDINDLGALIELKAIGFPATKAQAAKNLTEFIVNRLGAPIEHVEIEFIDMPPSTLSISGKLMG